MFKRKVAVFLFLIMVFAFPFPASAAQPVNTTVLVFGQKVSFDVQPVLDNGRILVPMRQIAEALGADISFDKQTDTVTLQKGSYTISLGIGKQTATKTVIPSGLYTELDTDTLTLDVPAKIISGRTMVPVRFVAESFDIDVSWNSKTKTVNVGMYLVDAPSKPGWKILKGHPYENEGVLYVKTTSLSDGYSNTEYDMADLLYDHSKLVTWTDGKKNYQATRGEAFDVISDLSGLLDDTVLQSWFGSIYDEWDQWTTIQTDLPHFYDRYLNSVNPDKYAITGTNLNDTYQFSSVKIIGVLDNDRNSVFAGFDQTMEKISEWCGQPKSTEKQGVATEAGTKESDIQYMTIADYGAYSLFFVNDAMVGFTTNTEGYGNDQIFVGDSADKIYSTLGVDPKDPTAHETIYGNDRIILYLSHDSGSQFTRITKEEAMKRDDYYELIYDLDSDSRITGITLQ